MLILALVYTVMYGHYLEMINRENNEDTFHKRKIKADYIVEWLEKELPCGGTYVEVVTEHDVIEVLRLTKLTLQNHDD